jgi:hypothetical protein
MGASVPSPFVEKGKTESGVIVLRFEPAAQADKDPEAKPW